jgi:hypothetical protein
MRPIPFIALLVLLVQGVLRVEDGTTDLQV